jgi:hypothetical protein
MFEASLPLCIITSICAGVSLVLSSACLAYASNESKKMMKDDGRDFPKKYWALAYLTNIACQFFSYGFQILSTFFGPISVAVPISMTTQLLTNMLIFGAILKLETVTKEIRVGTFVNCVAVVLLIFTGAESHDQNQDILSMLQKPESIVWSSITVALAVIALPYIFLLGCTSSKYITEGRTFFFLMLTELSCSLIAATTFKMLALVDGMALGITIALATWSNVLLLYSSMLRAVDVPNQTVYIPIAASAYLGATGLTGKMVWEDNIQSVGGYVCVYILFLLSGYLLAEFEHPTSIIGERGSMCSDHDRQNNKRMVYPSSSDASHSEEGFEALPPPTLDRVL